MGLGTDGGFQNGSCWEIPVRDTEIGRRSLRKLTAAIKTWTGHREPKLFGYNPAVDWQELPWAIHFLSLLRKWSFSFFQLGLCAPLLIQVY